MFDPFAEPGSRVGSMMTSGGALDPDKVYSVDTNYYMLSSEMLEPHWVVVRYGSKRPMAI